MELTFNYGYNNTFKVILKQSVQYGELYLIINNILGINVNEIAYLIFNDMLINDEKSYKFTNKINVYAKIAIIYIILSSSPPNNKIQVAYANYANIKKNNNVVHDFFDAINITLSDADFYKKVIIIEPDNLDNDDKELICLCGEEVYTESVALLPCNHLFHESCIKHHLTTIKTYCPLCNDDMRNY